MFVLGKGAFNVRHGEDTLTVLTGTVGISEILQIAKDGNYDKLTVTDGNTRETVLTVTRVRVWDSVLWKVFSTYWKAEIVFTNNVVGQWFKL